MAEIISDSIDFAMYMRDTDTQTKVKPASAWHETLRDKLRAKSAEKRVFLPWEKVRENFQFRPGEVSLWPGQNGHGKSLVLCQVALSLMGQGEKVCIASLEMKPYKTLQRMSRMFCGVNPFSPEFQADEGFGAIEELYSQFFGWTDNRLWLYDQTGTADTETMLGMTRYCAKELGVTHIVIDNLAKCIPDEDAYNDQKWFVDELTAIARDYACHIHLAHHLKKPSKEYDVPDKHDTKGSGSITDLVDNVLIVWRNKAKEDDVKSHGIHAKKVIEPDQLILCRKQRNYEGSADGEPTIKLWFHHDAQQYVSGPNDPYQFFPNYPHYQSI